MDLQLLLLIPCGVLLAYLMLLSILALFVRPEPYASVFSFRRFAVVVPAHNEERVIEKTLRSLLAMKYPRQFFDIVVVADNCTDRTAYIAYSLGVTVYERRDPARRGKGYALRWGFDHLLDEHPEYYALAVVDADSVVSPNFLSVMNYYLASGACAVQSSGMVEPQPGAWSSEVTRLGLTLYNHVRPLGRRMMGCSTGLRGTGMCLTAQLLRRIPWCAYSRTEDLEYGLELLLHDIPVAFAPEAVVRSTMPGNPDNAVSQRARWETGRFSVIRKYAGPLLHMACTRTSFKALDAFIDLVMPAFVNLLAVAMAMGGVNGLLWLLEVNDAGFYTAAWLTAAAMGVAHVVVGLGAVHADRSLYMVFFHFPRYVYWKWQLYIRLLRRGQTEEWVRTTRE
jgi:cellulose synthase/poly-beta-1,6-N-acetylglucosamine synthase-like glycosyltransferase